MDAAGQQIKRDISQDKPLPSAGESAPDTSTETPTENNDKAGTDGVDGETAEQKAPIEEENRSSEINLSHTYTTRFEEINMVTSSAFTFGYPDGWTITSEEVTPMSERVILTNDAGTTITYWSYHAMRDLDGQIREIHYVDAKRVADAEFIPGYVSATDYSDLGAFVVARLETIGEYVSGKLGREYVEISDGNVRYALLPEAQAVKQEEFLRVEQPSFSFWYAGHISLIADTPNENFTEQEEKEIIAILSSFQNKYASQETTNVQTAISVDDLLKRLKGTWILEEYKSMGSTRKSSEHILEFQNVDGKLYLNRDDQIDDDREVIDHYCHEIIPLDDFHLEAYTYRKGSYGGEWENWSDDVVAVWWSLDLSNLSIGELSMTYNVAWGNGRVDSNDLFIYSRR